MVIYRCLFSYSFKGEQNTARVVLIFFQLIPIPEISLDFEIAASEILVLHLYRSKL